MCSVTCIDRSKHYKCGYLTISYLYYIHVHVHVGPLSCHGTHVDYKTYGSQVLVNLIIHPKCTLSIKVWCVVGHVSGGILEQGNTYLFLCVDLCLSLDEHSHNIIMSMKWCCHEWSPAILCGLITTQCSQFYYITGYDSTLHIGIA